MMDFRRVWLFVMNLIFPQRCAGCGVASVSLCEGCLKELEGLFMKGEIIVDGFRVFFAARHGDVLKKVLHQFKYISDYALVEVLGGLLAKRIVSVARAGETCIIVPIPLHPRRERERGFNQSELLAKVVVREVGGRVVRVLERNRETEPQARLSREKRVKNVKEAFRVRENFVEMPKVVFVLDDVITTGSTFAECAKVLRSAGVEQVYGIMLAHGL